MNCASGWPAVLAPPEDLCLMFAVDGLNYQKFYAALKKRETPIGEERALELTRRLICTGGTAKAVQTLLDHSPPLESLLALEAQDWRGEGMVADAARCNCRILELLLRRGASPNRSGRSRNDSPLETAIAYGMRSSVRLLLEAPGLDTSLTPRLLELWAMAEWQLELRACWRLAAPRVAGVEMPPSGPVPLLKELTVVQAARAGGWGLVDRICRERGELSVREGLEVLKLRVPFQLGIAEAGWEELSALLDLLFTVCPALLRRKRPQQLLVLCCLCQPEVEPAIWSWLDRMPRRTMALWSEESDITERQWFGEEGLLARWRERLGDRLTPVLDRRRPLPLNGMDTFMCDWEWYSASKGELASLLRACPVRGRARPGEASPLAQSVLAHCDGRTVMEQLEPGGFLAQEDPGALLACGEDCPPAVRRILAACVKRSPQTPYLL